VIQINPPLPRQCNPEAERTAMRSRFIPISLVVLAACAAAPAPDQLAPSTRSSSDSAEAGRILAEQKCSACHATGAAAVSPVPEAPPFTRVAERFGDSELATTISEGLATGHPSMPRWIFSPGEARDLMAYIRSLRGADRS
jgi:mono/diheme cytochrome c family protein